MAPLSSVMLPFSRIRLPTVEPDAAVSTPHSSVPVVVRSSSPKLMAPLSSVMLPSPRLRVPTSASSAVSLVRVIESSMSIVFPVLVRLVPAVTWPAPLNCENVSGVLPTVTAPGCTSTQPVSSLTVPSSTKVKAPPSTSASASKSVARVGVPLAFTV